MGVLAKMEKKLLRLSHIKEVETSGQKMKLIENINTDKVRTFGKDLLHIGSDLQQNLPTVQSLQWRQLYANGEIMVAN